MSIFLLGRQSLLAGHLLQFRQVGIRIAAKAGTQSACLAPLIETVAKLLPLASIGAAQISATGWRLAGRDGRDQARLTAQHDGGRGGLAAGGPSLVVALRAEFVFQIVVGARQVRNTVAVKQPRTVAARDLAEALDRTAQATGTPTASATSRSSGARSAAVPESRLRASSTSPERQSRITHRTSCPTSGCRPSSARITRPCWASSERSRVLSVTDVANRSSYRSSRLVTLRSAIATCCARSAWWISGTLRCS